MGFGLDAVRSLTVARLERDERVRFMPAGEAARSNEFEGAVRAVGKDLQFFDIRRLAFKSSVTAGSVVEDLAPHLKKYDFGIALIKPRS
jgi:hypothetical protein